MILPTALGGYMPFKSLAMTDDKEAIHEIDLPWNVALVGLLLETQAIVLASSGIEFLNGCSLRLSSY